MGKKTDLNQWEETRVEFSHGSARKLTGPESRLRCKCCKNCEISETIKAARTLFEPKTKVKKRKS